MNFETILVNSDSKLKLQVCFVINNLTNYKVKEVYNSLDEVKHLNKDTLLIVSLNTDKYATDYLSINEIINKHPGIRVLVLTSSASKDIISKAFYSQCSAIVDKQHFQLFTEFILESIITFRGFYVSPLFVKYLIEESQINTVFSTVFLSRKQNDVAYYLSKGYSYIEIANEMNISVNTTRMHARLLYRKINIKSRFELIDMLHNGMLKLNPITFNPIVNKSNFIYITEKENKVLTLLKDNKNIKEIASELSITQFSTKYNINKLKQKNLII